MDREIYLHAINSVPDDYYHPDETNQKLLQILKRRALLSTKLQRRRPTGGFNGRDYVSLCDYDKRNDYKKFMGKYNAFYIYVRYSLSLAFPKDKISVIKPKVLELIIAFNVNAKSSYQTFSLNSNLFFTKISLLYILFHTAILPKNIFSKSVL